MKNVFVILITSAIVQIPATRVVADDVSFVRDVAPILLRRCSGCHGPKKKEGDYRLHTFEDLTRAGESEVVSLVPGKPDQSELFRRIIETDAEVRMPQLDDPLSKPQIELIRKWIESGAKFDGRDKTASLKLQLPPRQHTDPPEVYRMPVPVMATAFSPNGERLAVGGYHEVTIWNAKNGKLQIRLKRLPQRIQRIVWMPDGNRLLVGGGSPGDYGELSLVDIKSAKRRVIATFGDIVLGVALNAKGNHVAAGTADRMSAVFELANNKLIWNASVHSDWVTGIAFSPDEKFVVSSSKDQTLKVHNAETGELFTTYNGHRRQLGKYTGRFAVYDIQFDSQGGHALSVGEGRAIRVWEPVKAQQENGTARDMEGRFFKEGHTRHIEHQLDRPSLRIVAAAGQAIIAGANGVAKQFDIESGKLMRTFEGHQDWIYSLAVDPSSKYLATASYDGEVRVWNRYTGKLVVKFVAAPGLGDR